MPAAQRQPARSALVVLLFVLALAPGAVRAQGTCPAGQTPCDLTPQELVEPCDLTAERGVLHTALPIELKTQQVPVWTKNAGTWTCCMQGLTIPAYVPREPHCQELDARDQKWFPAPTLRLSKPDRKGRLGDRLSIDLLNTSLPPDSGHECNPCTGCSTPPGPNDPQCCKQVGSGFEDKFPNCFHGDNTTNLHFHGTHVSPQEPQDWVLLDLMPASSTGMAPAHGRGRVEKGSFPYRVDPLRWTQPEGTHWYHPHKHGATALQVANGMAGALIIRGPFDDWLERRYRKRGRTLEEKVMVLQQVQLGNNLFKENPPVPQPLINGQAAPKITMRQGEVQRWRLVGATMEGAAQLTLDFDSPTNHAVDVRQIAMDGVRFSPQNYAAQPLLSVATSTILLSPGNRIDVLVQAPAEVGSYPMTFVVSGNVQGERRLQAIEEMHEALAAVNPVNAPQLLTIEVVPCERGAGACAMDFPERLPRLPRYLRDIRLPPGAPARELWFRLEGPTGADVGAAVQPSQFFINTTRDVNQQYRLDCVPLTATLGTSEKWTIFNSTRTAPGKPPVPKPFHVFHMHTNPFQVVEAWGLKSVDADGNDVCGTILDLTQHPVWMDSVTLPSACNADGKTNLQPGRVTIRQRYEDFTGEFVLHCHFLGHEDRGMMLGVQVVCPQDPGYFGTPRADGGVECRPPFTRKAAPRCEDLPPPATAAAGHH